MIRENIEDIYNTNEEPNKIDFENERNKIYFSRRKKLKNMLKEINTYINNNSQSLFSAFYYMDLIFTNSELEKVFFSHFNIWNFLEPLQDIQMNNYALLSLACLIISYKFNENDPKLPNTSSFIKLLYHFSKKNFIFSISDLAMAEVVVIKLLKYKLTYFSIYHFFVFFFTHGILFKITLQSSILYEKYSELKILEQIYIQAREILDWIIDSEEYFNYYFGKDNHIIVVEIILWVIEHILGIKIPDNENLFKLIYNINISDEKHKKIVEIIEKLYKLKKGNLENMNKPIFINKNYSKKTITYNNQLSFASISNSVTQSNYNYNSLQNNITSSFNTIYNTLPTYDNSYSYNNYIIDKEFYKSNKNYPIPFIQSNKQQKITRIKENNIPKFTNLKNKAFYSNKKNITSSYDINSIIPINNTIIHNFPSNLNLFKTDNKNNNNYFDKKEKEPSDTSRKTTNDIQRINIENIQGKKIYINNEMKIAKKGISNSKRIYNSVDNNNNYQLNSSFIDINNINNFINNQDELNFEEKINKPKIFDNKIKININNNIYSISPNKNSTKNIIKNKDDKETLFKKYQQGINEHNFKFLKKKVINKHIPKESIISTEDLINETKDLYTVTKINQTVENEPRDNTKRIFNKKNENNIINNINKHNTIIINNNIHINTYLDNNKSLGKKKFQNIIIDNLDDKNVSELFNLHTLSNKYKNLKINHNSIYDLKNGENIIKKILH